MEPVVPNSDQQTTLFGDTFFSNPENQLAASSIQKLMLQPEYKMLEKFQMYMMEQGCINQFFNKNHKDLESEAKKFYWIYNGVVELIQKTNQFVKDYELYLSKKVESKSVVNDKK